MFYPLGELLGFVDLSLKIRHTLDYLYLHHHGGFMNHCTSVLIGAFIASCLCAGIAEAEDASSIFFDQALPIRASVDLHDALKQGEFSKVYVRPRNYGKKPVRPVYQINLMSDFSTCNQFDDGRTLYKDILGFKLSAAIFDKDSTIDLFMEEPRSAELLNGECLLAKPIGMDAPESEIQISYKSKKRDFFIVAKGSEISAPIDTLDMDLPTIRSVLAGNYEPKSQDGWKPRVRPKNKEAGLVSDENIVRALSQGNETVQHVALYWLRERIGRYFGDGVDISEKPQSKAIANTLLAHKFLTDDDEIKRASVLQALAAVLEPNDSGRAKAAIITAMDTEFPFTMDRADRDSGARFGISYPSEGEGRKGHQSRKITLGTAVLLQVMSETDRNDIIARYPKSYDKLFTGTYKNLSGSRALRKLVRGK